MDQTNDSNENDVDTYEDKAITSHIHYDNDGETRNH
jgi:hypothetical protein